MSVSIFEMAVDGISKITGGGGCATSLGRGFAKGRVLWVRRCVANMSSGAPSPQDMPPGRWGERAIGWWWEMVL
jgi:hypothetical protein